MTSVYFFSRVMITASHNPKEDNGYKVFWSNGPQIKPPHDKYILQSISANLQPKEGQDSFSDDLSNFKEALVNPEEFADAYYNTLKSLLYDETMNSKFDKKIVYSAMHGVGASYIDRAFATAKFAPVVHVQEQRQPDPNFPTVGKYCLFSNMMNCTCYTKLFLSVKKMPRYFSIF